MQFTVTIVTCNRAVSLRHGLSALAAQDYPRHDLQVIVADNGSTDGTRALCDEMEHEFENFLYLHDDRPGQLVGWHRALAMAEGEITCFIDDDARPRSGWLAALAEAYGDAAVGMATGPIIGAYGAAPPHWLDHMRLGEPGRETLPLLGLLNAGEAAMDIPGNFVWGTNFTVRRSLLLEARGFHPCAMPWPLIRFYGDGEVYVGRRVEAMGHRVLYHPGAAVDHVIPADRLTFDGVYAKFVSAGCARSFQHLRELREPYERPGAEEIEAIAARYFRDSAAAPVELVDAVRRGLADGIAMHLGAFTEDPAFRDWVLRDDYLDLDAVYVHPDLKPLAGDAAGGDWRHGGAGA